MIWEHNSSWHSRTSKQIIEITIINQTFSPNMQCTWKALQKIQHFILNGLFLYPLKQRGAGRVDHLLHLLPPLICKSESFYLPLGPTEHFHFCGMWTLNQSLEEGIIESLRVNLRLLWFTTFLPFLSLVPLCPHFTALSSSILSATWGFLLRFALGLAELTGKLLNTGLLIIAVAQTTVSQLS